MICKKLQPLFFTTLVLVTASLAPQTVGDQSRPAARLVHPRDGSEMVLVPEGEFLMGSDDGETDERPLRRVNLPAFYIDACEVTNAQYKKFIDATKYHAPLDWGGREIPKDKERFPVVNVTWYDAMAYMAWAGKRLPTEAEWEKAARGVDGRTYPWGNAWDEAKANLTSKQLEPVGQRPANASPYGCVDMIGNVWEWTADWYDRYPGSEELSIHFGKKYKVIRGGGTIYYYGVPGATRCSDRARSLPYGRYDALGFRGVMDPKASAISGRNQEAKEESPTVLPSILSPQLTSPVLLTVAETAGMERVNEVVTSGVPFPLGAIKSAENVRLLGADGKEIPLQARAQGTWRDGSVKWILLDFPASLKPGESKLYRLEFGSNVQSQAVSGIRISESPQSTIIDTGRARFELSRSSTIISGPGMTGLRQNLVVQNEKHVPISVAAQPPEGIVVEDNGPVHSIVRIDGWITDERGSRLFKYTFRIHASAQSSDLRCFYTLTHLNPQHAMLYVQDWSLDVLTAWKGPVRCTFGGNPGEHTIALPQGDVILVQDTSEHYSVHGPNNQSQNGTRAPGWAHISEGNQSLSVGIRHFWEQFPKFIAVFASNSTVRLGLWTGKEPFDWDQGLAKTHEIILRTDTGRPPPVVIAPRLFAVAPSEWYCATKGFGDLTVYNLDLFPYYEGGVEQDTDLWIRNRPYGIRNFGDAYYGGPYKGKNSFADLEYDVPYNSIIQFARTGNRKYLEGAMVQAAHQADIDINHLVPHQWKHSPRHTEIIAEFGHVFLRGLVEHYHMTGDRRSLEAAREIGEHILREIKKPSSWGNERQIGWSLYALAGIYEATWDEKYLVVMRDNIHRLAREIDNVGRLKIRYDNRISFFHGVTLSGLLKYYETTKDEIAADLMVKLCDRMAGFYPEYGGRTLEGLVFVSQRTGDGRYRDMVDRTWETSLDWGLRRGWWNAGSTIFACRFLPFAERAGMATGVTTLANDKNKETSPFSISKRLTPLQLASENGLYRHHLRTPSAKLYFLSEDNSPFEVVLFRHGGTSPARATLKDLSGQILADATMPATADPTQRLDLSPQRRLPTDKAGHQCALLLTLSAETTVAWDVVTTKPMKVVVCSDHFAGIESLTPRIYFKVKEGVQAIKVRLAAEGEGFKGITIYNPHTQVAGALARFIDLGDEGRYFYELPLPVPTEMSGQVWAADIQDCKVVIFDGVRPYFATSRESWFEPDHSP